MKNIKIELTKDESLVIKSLIGGNVTYEEMKSISSVGFNGRRNPKRVLEKSILQKIEDHDEK